MSGQRTSESRSPSGALAALAIALLATSAPAATRTLMVLNPWDGQLGISPTASFDGGGTWRTTRAMPGFCGWYGIQVSDTSRSVRFAAPGKDTTDAIALRWSGDTMYVSDVGTPTPLVTRHYGGQTGMCLVAQLPATIRDFDSGARSPDFDSSGYPVDSVFKGLVQPLLGDDSTPIASARGAKYFKKFDQWFHSIDSVNATTCIEIPLALNTTGTNKGLYTKYDAVYFPIDTFKNPFNNLVTRPKDERYRAAEDSALHNFSFCLESHSEFEYAPGQKFKFSGDDDVWVYIDRKLVIDLGGIHSETSDSVLLDTMGLVPGKTYSWDFFFCERHINRSHLRIVTDLNLRGRSNFRIEKTPGATPKITTFSVQGDRPGVGCAPRVDYSSLGRYRLLGPTGTAILPAGTSFGGIEVDPDFGSVTIDTSMLSDLEPGAYTLRTLAWGDTTVSRDFEFSVPPLPIPVFAGSKPAYSGPIGSGLWVPVTEIRPDNGQPTGQAVVFRIPERTGLSFCLDSLCNILLGAGDTLMTGTGGLARRLWIRGDAVGTYDLEVATAGGRTTDRWTDLAFFGSPPDSGWFLDRDGDGRVDGAVVHLPQPWSPENVLRLAWPDVDDTLTILPSEITPSADGREVEIRLEPGREYGIDRTAASDPGALLGEWSWDTSHPLARFPMRDRVAPVPIEAWLSYGNGQGRPDTLFVSSSEQLGPLTESDVARIFRTAPGSWNLGNQIGQELSESGYVLKLFYDPDRPEVEPAPGDSVRFSPRAGTSDTLGNRPGDTAKAVVIRGSDRAPLWAKIFDTDADGRADQVVMRFRGPLQSTHWFEFRWPDTTGALQSRDIDIGRTMTDSGGLLVIAALPEPFPFGATSCPAAGCADLGSMHVQLGSSTTEIRFPILDGVDPVILSAKLRYAFTDDRPDTLRLRFSEPMTYDLGTYLPWVSWKHPAADPEGLFVPVRGHGVPSSDSVDLFVRVSDTFPLVRGDLLRITQGGTLSDKAGNQPETFAYWAPIEFGPTPLRLRAAPYVPVRVYHESWGDPPKNVPNVTVLVRGSRLDDWRTLDGKAPPIDTTRLTGVVMRTNRMVLGGFYLYDNMGIFVTSADVRDVNRALQDGSLQPDPRGFYEIFFAWNGRADGGKLASTGIYYTRIFGWKNEGAQKILVNEVRAIGWRVAP